MSEQIIRYQVCSEWGYGFMSEDESGEYVKFEDYAKQAERIKALEAALIQLRDCDWTITLPDRMDAVREIAGNALGAGYNGEGE